MSFYTLKLVAAPLPPAAVPGGSNANNPAVAVVKRSLLPVQVRGREEQKLRPVEVSSNVSRRDLALGLVAAASLGVASLSLTETAEARVVKPETRKKIFEKLKMLREKAGLSKQKSENGEKKAPSESSAEDIILLPPVPLPNLKKSGGSVVEVTLP